MVNLPEEIRKYIRTLYLLMQLSRKAYAKYMQQRIYLHAICIRLSNQKIYNHIINNISVVPSEIEEEVLDIINHYDIWMTQFAEYEALKKPSLADEFVFYHIDKLSSFPKQAEKRVVDYYLQNIKNADE